MDGVNSAINMALSLLLLLAWTSWPLVGGQQQRFRVRPTNVSVVQGSRALLRCEVQHQYGQLQWAKDGFALGYSRALPGYPRYQMVGDPGSGVHDLEISNVTLDDDGRFQCQVSPNRGQAAIKADAFLTVLVPPQSVTISSSAPSPEADVFEVKQGHPLTLRCDVTGSRPAANVIWQRNGQNIQPGQEDTFIGREGSPRNDTRSVMTVRPSAADDAAGYSCVVAHPAVDERSRSDFNATVLLSVLYPPGPPKISGYREGDWTKIDQRVTLTCTSTGGNPPAQLVWYRDQQRVPSRYRSGAGRASAALQFTVQVSDLSAIYRCQASSEQQPQPAETRVQLNVEFGPEEVAVTGTREAKGGETLHMHCRTSSSNPPANITWVINGRTMMNTSQSRQPDVSGGWVSTSNLSLEVPPGLQQNMQVSCYALNARLGRTEVGTSTVQILHPPLPPTIHGYQSGSVLRAGDQLTLTCVSRGGSPLASLTWLRADQELPAAAGVGGQEHQQEVEEGVSRSVLTLRVAAEDNGRTYRCLSENEASDGVQTAQVTLNVHFSPDRLHVEVSPPQLRAGQQALLTCESPPARPAADLSWWRGQLKVTDGVAPMETFPAGTNGGQASRLQLRRSVTWRDDQARYTCRAEVAADSDSDSDSDSGDLQQHVRLLVRYPPTYEKDEYVENVPVGNSHVINLTASANPADTVYHWSRATPLDGTRITMTGPVLRVAKMEREDAGWYELEATNSEGSTAVRVNVNVLYGPEIMSVSSVSLVSPGEDGVLECVADANPTTADMISWQRPDLELAAPRVTAFYGNGTSYLTIHNVTVEDIGEFTCRVDNGIGRAEATARLLVMHGVRMSADWQPAKAAAAEGATARLTCHARGVPNVTFEWYREDGRPLPTQTQKYTTSRAQVGVASWESVLTIRDVTSSDLGPYRCEGVNSLGSAHQLLQLQRPAAPDPPAAVRVLNASHHTVALVWTPGFDGGLTQVFRIRYRSTGSGSYQYRDVPAEDTAAYTVSSLRPSSEYSFAIMARNELGDSGYSPDVTAETSGTPPVGYVTDREDPSKTSFPRLTVVVIIAVSAVLLLLNAVFIACYRRRRRHGKLNNAASEASTKSETLHMYGNETVSSVSVKSAGSYIREDSTDANDDEALRRPYDTYGLIDPPAEYGAQSYSPTRAEYAARAEYVARAPSRADFHSPVPSSPTRDYDSETYADALRRNSYACTIGTSVEPMSSQLNTYATQPPRAPQFRAAPYHSEAAPFCTEAAPFCAEAAFGGAAPDLLHSSTAGALAAGPASVNGSASQLSHLRVQQLPAEVRHSATLPRQRPPPAHISSFQAGPAPRQPLEERGHLV